MHQHRVFVRLSATLAAIVASCMAMAGQITVTSPNNGDFLGQQSDIRFNITGAVRRVTVTARIVRVRDDTVLNTYQRFFDPDVEGRVTGTIQATFEESTPTDDYRITVNATEEGNDYNQEVRDVKIDARRPEFLTIQPISNSFVKGDANGNVAVRVSLDEPNMKEWRVRVNERDIPNNSGDTNEFTVLWNVSGIRLDGQQEITVVATDRAENSRTQELVVTLDRVPPDVTIESPGRNFIVLPRTNIGIGLRVTEQFNRSLDLTGIDVIARTLDDRHLARAARRFARYVEDNESVLNWAGRLRFSNNFPGRFKVVVSAVDKAGNAATIQEIQVQVSGRGRGR